MSEGARVSDNGEGSVLRAFAVLGSLRADIPILSGQKQTVPSLVLAFFVGLCILTSEVTNFDFS